MYMHIPVIDWLPVLGGPLVAAGLFIAALARGAGKAGLPKSHSTAAIAAFTGFVVVWFVAYAFFAARGTFSFSSATRFPVLPIALLIPALAVVIAFRTVPALRAMAENIPHERLIGIQVVRLMGFAFLLLLAQSLLPAVFALPAGLGDMFVGFEAIIVAGLYARNAPSAPMMGLIWNLTGIADFALALAIGFLASTTPLQLIHVLPNTDLVAVLPLALVPTFGVPLFLVLHVLSLRRVIRELKSTVRAVPA